MLAWQLFSFSPVILAVLNLLSVMLLSNPPFRTDPNRTP